MVDRDNSGRSDFGSSQSEDNISDSEGLRPSNLPISEARLKTVLETSVDGIIVTNDRSRVLVFNKACEKMFGYQANEVVGQNTSMLMPPRNARMQSSSVAAYLDNELNDMIGGPHEVSGLHRNGLLFPIELTIGEIDTPTGRQFIGILRDLRQRYEIQARLNDLQQELLRLSRLNVVEEMGTAMAHELNQPLTAMMLYLQAIEKKTRNLLDFDPNIRQILEKALRETERASQIIQSVRRFSKKTVKRSTLADIGQLVREALDLTLVGYRVHGVKVNVDIAPDLPRASVDVVQIQQVIVNLLRNALDALIEKKKPRIWVSAWQENGSIAIAVRDSGDGIPNHIYDDLFTTFASSKESGMGLGLAISNAIAQSHDGSLSVEPGGDGRGATFTLKLPVEGH